MRRKLVWAVAACLAVAVPPVWGQQGTDTTAPAGISNPDPLNPAEPLPEAGRRDERPAYPQAAVRQRLRGEALRPPPAIQEGLVPAGRDRAWNWEHVNTGGPNRTGYGIPPNQEGTYFWYLNLDP